MNSSEPPLYQQIAEHIRHAIIDGHLKPGERLPSVRQMTEQWQCTPGTVQRAYRELSRQNLISSRPGQGTHILAESVRQINPSLQKAKLVHQAEKFILEAITNAYSTREIEQAFQIALDRWKTAAIDQAGLHPAAIVFSGSHDVAVNWVSSHFPAEHPQFQMQVSYTGSLGGLIALAEKKANVAGAHLWDSLSSTYNIPYVQKILPGKRTALVTLSLRRLGLIVEKDNPLNLHTLQDLSNPHVRYINRQAGSGTRVWFDRMLQENDISPADIPGYENEVSTHSDVARQIVEGQANVGIGLEATALAFSLGFTFLTLERYDLVIPEDQFEQPAVQALVQWLQLPAVHQSIAALGGYDTQKTGQVQWVE
ncbi:MAG: GntR family transcriptional regulator [Chloroflexi bacterium]|nr:GntR family transcriptional regulator [Chloroflexota bacterium]